MLSVGLVGLPNAGKSTLFNLLTKRTVPAENFPFTTIDPNDGVVEVPDERVKKLAKMVGAQKEIYAAIEFRDIAGLIKNAHKGEGLGNQFLSHIKEVDLILMVLRKFKNDDIVHVENRVNPEEDKEILLIELGMADEKVVAGAIERLKKEGKKDAKASLKMEHAELILKTLQDGKLVNSISKDDLDDDVKVWRKTLNLLTDKPFIFLGNISDGENVDFETDFDLDILFESELADMAPEERVEFGASKESGMDKMIQKCYETLDLGTYLTAGEKEARAWTFTKGWTAPKCAAVIHTDFEKKFIKAEIIKYDDFMSLGGRKGAVEKGKMRQEGKEYVMQDGDVVEFVIGK